MITLYILAITALVTSTAFVAFILVNALPVQGLFYHFFLRKPIAWTIFVGALICEIWRFSETGAFRWEAIIPLALMGLAVVLAYRFHPSTVFKAVDYPKMSDSPLQLPINDDMTLAIVECDGESKAYPLDYLIHGHIVNDRFGDHIISLTYCALCRGIVPFDVTDIGPLFVAGLKNGNMIVADKKTKTHFQQATFESIIGPLHPHTLKMIGFQVLPWSQVKRLEPLPKIVHVTEYDFREFKLPIPGVWRMVSKGNVTPSLPSKKHDKTFPARTPVIGVIDPVAKPQVVYLKSELTEQGVVKNEELDVFFVALGDSVNAFKASVAGDAVDLSIDAAGILTDRQSSTTWDIRGKYQNGAIDSDLEKIVISEEYWYSWKLFHPRSQLIRLK